MISRRYRLMALTICALIAIFLLSQAHGIKAVSITENFAQEQISKQIGKDLPVKGPAALAIKKVSLQGVDIHIGDGQVHISAKLNGDLRFGKSFSLVSSAIGIPTYSDGAFYFHPDKIKIQELSFQGQQVRAEGWMMSLVEAAAMHAFEKRPIYRLKNDAKGFIIRSTLTSMAVVGDHIEVTLSLWQITKAVMAGILLMILSAGFALSFLVESIFETVVEMRFSARERRKLRV
jgi:hypothetical protein